MTTRGWINGLRCLPQISRDWKHGSGWVGFSMHRLMTSRGGLMTVILSIMSGAGVARRRVIQATRPAHWAGTVMT